MTLFRINFVKRRIAEHGLDVEIITVDCVFVRSLRHFALVVRCKEILRKVVEFVWYCYCVFCAALFRLGERFDEFFFCNFQVVGSGEYVLAVTSITDYIVICVFTAFTFVDARGAALCAKFFFESFWHFAKLLLAKPNIRVFFVLGLVDVGKRF